MPVRRTMGEALESDSSYTFPGTPENIDVEKEVNKAAGGMAYDPYRLSEALMKIGQKMIGVQLYSYQEAPAFRIIYSMLAHDGARLTMLFARQSGKSEVITFAAITLGVLLPVLAKIFPKQLGHFARGVKMGLLAPQGEQVQTVYSRIMDRLLSEPVRLFLDMEDIADMPLSSVHFKLKSGTFLTGQSAAKQSKIESKTYNIVFLDESQDMDTEKVRKSIMPMLASTFGTAVRTGTPGRNKGDFYFKIQENKKDDRKLYTAKDKRTKQLHYEFNYQDIIKAKKEQFKKDGLEFHLLYEKSVALDKKEMGENSDSFRMAYKIEWILDVGMFITESYLAEKVLKPKLTLPKIIPSEDFVVAGLDIASARNETVLTTGIVDYAAKEFGDRPKKTLADWFVLSGTNYEIQFHAIAEQLIQNHTKVLYADYTGVGRALTDVLMYHLSDYMEIIPYTFSPSTKSEMWKALDEDITNDNIWVPANKKVAEKPEFINFCNQMTNLQKMWKGTYMVCEKTQGESDDYCDSLALMNLAGNHLYTPKMDIEVMENTLIGTRHRANLKARSRW